MNKNYLIILLLGVCKALHSQTEYEKRVSLYFGQVFSSISYRNSSGETDAYLNSKIKSTYGVSYQRFMNKWWFIQPALSYINLGAQSTVNNQKVEWDFYYLGASLGTGIGRTRKFIYNDFIFKPYGTVSLYAQYAYKADQTIGEQYFNLLKDDEFRNFDMGLKLAAGLMVDFSQDMALDLTFAYMRSLINLEKLEHSVQKMHNVATIFSFGLIIKI